MDEMHFGGERDTRREVNRFSRCRAKYSLNGKPEEWRKRLLFTRRFKIFSCRNVIRNRIHRFTIETNYFAPLESNKYI